MLVSQAYSGAGCRTRPVVGQNRGEFIGLHGKGEGEEKGEVAQHQAVLQDARDLEFDVLDGGFDEVDGDAVAGGGRRR